MHALKPAMIQLHIVQYSIEHTGNTRIRKEEGRTKGRKRKMDREEVWKGAEMGNGTGQDDTYSS